MKSKVKTTIQIVLEDLEFNDVCDDVQTQYGSVSIANLEKHFKRRIGVQSVTLEKIAKEKIG
jgi:hypothetical protein